MMYRIVTLTRLALYICLLGQSLSGRVQRLIHNGSNLKYEHNYDTPFCHWVVIVIKMFNKKIITCYNINQIIIFKLLNT
jgi:hypothetical protein